MPYKVAAFYQFAALPDFRDLREPLRAICADLKLNGSVLLAHEGINGTLAGRADGVDALVEELRHGALFDGRLNNLELKFSHAAELPFGRLKVRLKKEIVTLGDASADPARQVGIYVEPAAWNALIDAADTLVVDTRNGGLRCEKASAYLLARGFEQVYHLKGGILRYLEEVREVESRWRGECFVFDERVALGHGLRERREKRPAHE